MLVRRKYTTSRVVGLLGGAAVVLVLIALLFMEKSPISLSTGGGVVRSSGTTIPVVSPSVLLKGEGAGPIEGPPPPPVVAHRDGENNEGTQEQQQVEDSNSVKKTKKRAKKSETHSTYSYTSLVHALILDELGPDLAAAIYDPDFIEINIVLEALSTQIANTTSTATTKTNTMPWQHPPEPPTTTKESSIPFISPDHLYFEEQGFHYNHMMIKNAPTIPVAMATIPMTLMTLKRAMSVGLGRLARDARLADNYRELLHGDGGGGDGEEEEGEKNKGLMVGAFRRSIRTVIKGFGQYATTFLQIVVDGNSRLTEIAEWEKAVKDATGRKGVGGLQQEGEEVVACSGLETCDPLLLLMGSMRISPPRWAVGLVIRNADPNLHIPIGIDGSGVSQLLRAVGRNRAIIGSSVVHGMPLPNALRPVSVRSHLTVAVKQQSSAGGGGAHNGGSTNIMENLPMPFRKVMSKYGRFTREEMGVLAGSGGEEDAVRTPLAPLPVLVLDDPSSSSSSSLGGTAVNAGGDPTSTPDLDHPPLTQQDLTFALAVEAEQIWIHRFEVLNGIIQTDTIPKRDILKEIGRVLPHSGQSFPANRALFGLQYQVNLPYTGSAALINGRFWNAIRPTVGCASISKQCEEPDGCRYFCNMDYFLAANGFTTSPFSTVLASNVPKGHHQRQYKHQVIGFGSNNEYEWEVSLVDAFERASRAFAALGSDTTNKGMNDHHTAPIANNTIGRITVFDCTVRNWSPPKHLTDSPIGFGHGTYCLDNRMNHQPPGASVSFPLLKRSISTELDGPNPLNIKRYGGGEVVAGSPGGVPPPPYFNPAVFDEVSIMKLDVEGFEHRTLPNWVTSELADMGRRRLLQQQQQQRRSHNNLIAFDVDAPNTYTVSHYGMELHRLGHKGTYAAGYPGALRIHYTLMQLYALGFAMFGEEKNPVDYCCFEIGMVHYRHFVRSETWHTAKA